ncbi:hypothetical protein AAG906_036978 [Vitis piasezkii]
MHFHHQYRAPPPSRPTRQFTQLGMPLSRAFQRLVEGGLISHSPAPPLTYPTDLGDLSCAYHQRAGHDIDKAPKPIILYEDSNFSGYTHGQQVPRPFRVSLVLLDNGSALNVCPLVIAIVLGFSLSDFGPFTQAVKAYDGTQRTIMGTLTAHVMIGPVKYLVLFQVLRIQSSFNLLLGRPWIHEVGTIPSSLHQKVKFIHEGCIITIQFDRDVVTSFDPVLQISHSEDDLHLTGFTFDEVQVVSLEDGNRDMVSMDMSYLPGLGLGRHQHGPREFTFTVDHDIPYGLGYTPTKEDACYMSRLRKDRMHLGTGIPETPDVMIVPPPSPNRASMFSVCFLEAIFDYDILMDTMIDADGVTLLDACTDEMDMIGVGRILDAVPHGPHSDFNLFGVSVIDTDDVTLYDACTDEMDMIGTGCILDAALQGPPSDSMDPPLSFDTMSGFITCFDDVAGGNNNNISVFEYSLVSLHFPLIVSPIPMAYIHDVDDVRGLDGPLMVEYLEWLANVVLVPKKDGKVRASPKDDFSLPHIDMLVDSTVGHSMLLFMDEFSRGHLSRAATTLFHDMMHRDVIYVDDMIVKSRDRRIRQFRLRLNPKNERGIKVDPEKIRAILDMPAPRTEREIKGFLGRLQYISRFIARLTDICEPIFCLLRKSQPTVWDDDLLDIAMGCMLAQLDDSGKDIVADHLASLPVFDDRSVDDDFPDEQFGDHIPRLVRLAFSDHHWLTNNVVEYEACIIGLETALDLRVRQPVRTTYCCLIGDIEDQDGLPWYHDIYQFLSCGAYLELATVKDRRALRQLATRFTNGAVEAANKNIKRILRKMVETSRDWSEKLPFALWAYRTSFRTSTGATPYSLVYGMEVVLPVEIEMGSLRVALEQ